MKTSLFVTAAILVLAGFSPTRLLGRRAQADGLEAGA